MAVNVNPPQFDARGGMSPAVKRQRVPARRKGSNRAKVDAIGKLETYIAHAIEQRLQSVPEAYNAVFEHPDGADKPVYEKDADNGTDIFVWVKIIPERLPGYLRGRLFAAVSSVWRLPQPGDSCLVIKAAGIGGNGGCYVLWGDGGGTNDVPAALDESTTYVSPPSGVLQLQSRDNHLKANAGSGKNVVFNDGTKKVSRVGDKTSGHAHSVTHALTAGPYPVTGTITIVSNTDTMAEGAEHVLA